ncbi:M56 family metallopeptidase [Rhodocytophaga aerolata]|uniref:M56 family metallopeptidase n=1 Tax=Rhodocytophaga aerolata TaxID=455078 RepID=A0ABT8RID0_9BACT|nr:M56 family metallopeptidase [Rhodocytophaga aerolata]MDO1451729.1 M56 family metallopeptidase [Rhodocytophaga aerolata]
MADLIYYSIKLSICLATVYLFYRLALRSLTFYSSNRWFLLIASGFSFLIPLVNLLPLLSLGETTNVESINALITWNKVSNSLFAVTNETDSFGQSMLSLIATLFWIGLLIQGVKLLIQFIAFFRVLHSATLVQDGDIKIYQVDKKIAPFSFGNAIFLNINLLEPEEIQQVIRHEWIHASQNHTMDVIWMECLLLFNWYNPFAWLLRQAVRENLEFIVDKEVLNKGDIDRKSYQYLLLKIIGLSNVQIANQFNISSLKTRIQMMNRKPSSTHSVSKYFLVLPLLVFLTFTFCGRVIEEAAPPPPPPPIVMDPNSLSFEAFLKKNKMKEFRQLKEGGGVFEVELESGKKETYDISDEKQKAIFEQRYGKLPTVVVQPE